MERTDHLDLDTVLARILNEPSWPHRLLTATAAHLEAGQPFLTLDPELLAQAEAAAADAVLAGLPDIVADEAENLAAKAMPVPRPRETAGEHALRIRAAARTV